MTSLRARHHVSYAALALALTPLLACLGGHDECELGEDRCEGNTVMICTPPCAEFGCGNSWDKQECGDSHCVDAVKHELPFCALSEQPDPHCSNKDKYCDRERSVQCNAGYAVGVDDCAERDQFCIADDEGPSCALSREPNPSCAAGDGPSDPACEGSTLLYCNHDYAILATPCLGACIALADEEAFCALASEPDPVCGAHSAVCDGDVRVDCRRGYALSREECGLQSGVCTQVEMVAYCEPLATDADGGHR